MLDIYLEHGLRIRQRLPGRLEHALQLRAQCVSARNHAGRRLDEALADVHSFNALLQDLANLLQEWLVLLLRLIGADLTRVGQFEIGAGGVDKRFALVFGQRIDQPRIDAIRQQEHFDVRGLELLEMRTPQRRRMVIGQNIVDLVLRRAGTLHVIVERLVLVRLTRVRSAKAWPACPCWTSPRSDPP